jgi:hypothetical protein
VHQLATTGFEKNCASTIVPEHGDRLACILAILTAGINSAQAAFQEQEHLRFVYSPGKVTV